MIACHGHNFTFVHRGHSFETSLQESIMWLKEQNDFTILTGGVDELTNHSFDIMSRFGTFKSEHESFDTMSEGTIAGEGSSMFVLSNQKQENSYAEIKDVCLCIQDDIAIQLSNFLAKNKLHPNDIDVCLLGVNGDSRYDETIMKNVESLSNAILVGFKKWCGEFPTSGSFALALASQILKHQYVPQQIILKTEKGKDNPKKVLIYNHYKNQFHSFTLLTKI
jgi:3-oxoacyl-(acyl-carrier-protein) synthase